MMNILQPGMTTLPAQIPNISVPTIVKEPETHIIPLWLRDTFARVQPTPILNYDGPPATSDYTEYAANAAVRLEAGASKHFLSGDKMFGYLYRHINQDMCNGIVTIVIPGLRNLYWTNRTLLPRDEQQPVEAAQTKPLPRFHNIYSYDSLSNYRQIANVPEYQLIGSITPYDVIHIPVRYFVDRINFQQPIEAELTPTDIKIQLSYEPYDFWDDEYQNIINHVDLTCGVPTAQIVQ